MDVSELTGFPEMMDGRVKTLHPKVHGGLLGVRDAKDHAKAMADHGIEGIDLVWIDLYPFEQTAAAGGTFEACVENIDIGGPAMIRSAAKNHGYVGRGLWHRTRRPRRSRWPPCRIDGGTTLELRRRLAAAAFARTASYDAAVSAWFASQVGEAYPKRKTITGTLVQTMRYGGNPDQSAALSAGLAARGRDHGAPATGQGAQLQQRGRHRRGLRIGGGIRSERRRRLRHHQTRQPVRRRRRPGML